MRSIPIELSFLSLFFMLSPFCRVQNVNRTRTKQVFFFFRQVPNRARVVSHQQQVSKRNNAAPNKMTWHTATSRGGLATWGSSRANQALGGGRKMFGSNMKWCWAKPTDGQGYIYTVYRIRICIYIYTFTDVHSLIGPCTVLSSHHVDLFQWHWQKRCNFPEFMQLMVFNKLLNSE